MRYYRGDAEWSMLHQGLGGQKTVQCSMTCAREPVRIKRYMTVALALTTAAKEAEGNL